MNLVPYFSTHANSDSNGVVVCDVVAVVLVVGEVLVVAVLVAVVEVVSLVVAVVLVVGDVVGDVVVVGVVEAVDVAEAVAVVVVVADVVAVVEVVSVVVPVEVAEVVGVMVVVNVGVVVADVVAVRVALVVPVDVADVVAEDVAVVVRVLLSVVVAVLVAVVDGDVVGVVTVQSWNPPASKASAIAFSVSAVASHSSTSKMAVPNAHPTFSLASVPSGPRNSRSAAFNAAAVSPQLPVTSTRASMFCDESTLQLTAPARSGSQACSTLFNAAACASQLW